MPADHLTPPDAHLNPPEGGRSRRLAVWTGIMLVLVHVACAVWYFGIELSPRREAAAQAAALAGQWAANTRTIPDLNLDLVLVAPGSFLMGTETRTETWIVNGRATPVTGTIPDEMPVTRVTLTQPFWVGRTAVTQRQYEKVMGRNPSHFTAAGGDAPVEEVSWDDAMAFCKKLTEREKAAGRLPAGYTYTLPTEAQREYACRAGTTGDYAGDLDGMAWYHWNSWDTTHPVGTKQPNGWGLFDMHGNVWEWCRDWYADKLPGGEVTDPPGPPSGSYRVYRGGSWRVVAGLCRSAERAQGAPDLRLYEIGFRLALCPVK